MSRIWALGDISKRVRLHEQAADALARGQGVSEEQRVTARAQLAARNQGQSAAQTSGIRIAGDNYAVEGVYNDGDTRRIVASRDVGGGRYERVTIREERDGSQTFVSAEKRGAR